MENKDLIRRVDYLIDLGRNAIALIPSNGIYVPMDLYNGFRSASLSFLVNLLDENHPYYKEFNRTVSNTLHSSVGGGIEILKALKNEIENGWLMSFKGLLTAEIFSNFLEMSKYLLDEKYEHPAAVMIGSVLEEHMRFLANRHNVEVTVLKGADMVPKKADQLNADLVKGNAYRVVEQKQITGWLHIRNCAAHGKYSEYTREQVSLMYQGVLDFIAKTS